MYILFCLIASLMGKNAVFFQLWCTLSVEYTWNTCLIALSMGNKYNFLQLWCTLSVEYYLPFVLILFNYFLFDFMFMLWSSLRLLFLCHYIFSCFCLLSLSLSQTHTHTFLLSFKSSKKSSRWDYQSLSIKTSPSSLASSEYVFFL